MARTFFLRSFIRDRDIGSVTPTSGISVKHICRAIDFGRRIVIVEYGPGTGVITRALLRRMSPDSLLIAIERNPAFVSYLHAHITDSRLVVICGSAEDVRSMLGERGIANADYVVSGIPFSFFPEAMRRGIVFDTHTVLGRGGAFIVYQYSKRMLATLQSHFPLVRKKRVLWNIPPLSLMVAEKGRG